MKIAFFNNITDKEFVGYWNKKAYKFASGEKRPMPLYLAEHFGKHLTNQILTSQGKELYCSPKKPREVAEFWNLFTQICLVEDNAQEMDDAEMQMAMASQITKQSQPSSNIDVKPSQMINPLGITESRQPSSREEEDKFDAHAHQNFGPGTESQVIGEDADDSEEFETGEEKANQ